MLKATNIHKSYGSVEVLKGVDLSIEKGEVVSITGASGAGKSTLLHILGILDLPDKGHVDILDTNILSLSSKRQGIFRNQKIGFIFQFHNLLPEFTALENVCIPALIKNEPYNEIKKRASQIMERLGVAHRANNKPSQLSGGEQQRVAVARALINNPVIIFADEPSGNLDSKTADELHSLFFELREELDQTFVIVTHNEQLASMADSAYAMKDGLFI